MEGIGRKIPVTGDTIKAPLPVTMWVWYTSSHSFWNVKQCFKVDRWTWFFWAAAPLEKKKLSKTGKGTLFLAIWHKCPKFLSYMITLSLATLSTLAFNRLGHGSDIKSWLIPCAASFLSANLCLAVTNSQPFQPPYYNMPNLPVIQNNFWGPTKWAIWQLCLKHVHMCGWVH